MDPCSGPTCVPQDGESHLHRLNNGFVVVVLALCRPLGGITPTVGWKH